MRSQHNAALSTGLAVAALGFAGCGGSSSSSSSSTHNTAATSMTTSSTAGAVQPKTAGSGNPTPAVLRVGQRCSASRQRTYAAHGLLCVQGRLHKVKIVHRPAGGSTHTSTGGSSGGAGIGGSSSSSGGAPVGQ
jgi:ABC-type phosphate transport system substrate-binding protein